MSAHAAQAALRRTFVYIGLVIFLLFLSFPIYYMLITSLKTPGEAYALPPTLFPRHPTFDAYPYVWRAWEYWRTLLNTLLVASASALSATLIGGLSAYGVARLRFPGKSMVYAFLVGSIAVPAMVTVGPIFLAYRQIGFLDTRGGLVLVFAAEGLPFAFLTLFAFFKAIPRELDEAAAMDGASVLGIFFWILAPLAMPGFAATFLLLFIAAWNEFLFAFTLTVTPETRLLTVRLFEVPVRADANTVPYDLIAAGGMLVLLPMVPLLLRVRKQLVQGILAGAIKE